MAYTTIKKPSDYFNTKLYTGTGSSNSVTGVGFQPDWVWIKHRNGTGEHDIYDAVRGATKKISSNTADAEVNQTNGLSAFGSDGFTVVNSTATNLNNGTYASWNWLANGAGVANTDGSISSTVSVNTTAGFSIVKFTGTGANATVGHGLGVKPNVIILKSYENGQQWSSYWSALGATKYMRFNTTDAAETASNRWNNTEPTTSVFTVSTDGEVNTNGQNQIAYCFAEKQGFSKFGSYTGNGSTDGTFVYTGFKPAMVIFKNTTTAGYDWEMRDNKRPNPFNPVEARLFPNTSAAESNDEAIDFCSNGFKLRGTASNWNRSGDTFIYMAFAEQPLVGDNPATAR